MYKITGTMKKLLILMLVLSLILVSGCAGKKDKNNPNPNETQPKQTTVQQNEQSQQTTEAENTETEHTQQWTICITCHLINSLNNRIVIEHMNNIDTYSHQYCHTYMY